MPGLISREYRKRKKATEESQTEALEPKPVHLRPTRFRLKDGVVGTAYYQLLWCTRKRKHYLGETVEEAQPCSEAIDSACKTLGGRLVFQAISPDGIFLIVGEILPTICIDEIVTVFKRHIWAELAARRPGLKKQTASIWDRKYWFSTVQSSDDMDTDSLRQQRRAFINAQTPKLKTPLTTSNLVPTIKT